MANKRFLLCCFFLYLIERKKLKVRFIPLTLLAWNDSRYLPWQSVFFGGKKKEKEQSCLTVLTEQSCIIHLNAVAELISFNHYLPFLLFPSFSSFSLFFPHQTAKKNCWSLCSIFNFPACLLVLVKSNQHSIQFS